MVTVSATTNLFEFSTECCVMECVRLECGRSWLLASVDPN